MLDSCLRVVNVCISQIRPVSAVSGVAHLISFHLVFKASHLISNRDERPSKVLPKSGCASSCTLSSFFSSGSDTSPVRDWLPLHLGHLSAARGCSDVGRQLLRRWSHVTRCGSDEHRGGTLDHAVSGPPKKDE